MPSTSSPPPFVDPAWLELHRQYWSAWSTLSGHNGSAGWSEALDRWWAAVAPQLPEASRQPYVRLIEQGRDFFQMGEALARALAGDGDPEANWLDAMQARMAPPEAGNDAASTAAEPGLPLTFPMYRWLAALPGFDASLGDWTVAAQSWLAAARRGADLPALGLTREHQLRVRAFRERVAELQRVLSECYRVQGRLATATMARLQESVHGRAQVQRPLTSVREFYDLWVDCAEHAYQDLVREDDYSALFGRALNAVMGVRRAGASLMSDALAVVGVPSRRDADALLHQVHDLRRELAQTKARIEKFEHARPPDREE